MIKIDPRLNYFSVRKDLDKKIQYKFYWYKLNLSVYILIWKKNGKFRDILNINYSKGPSFVE